MPTNKKNYEGKVPFAIGKTLIDMDENYKTTWESFREQQAYEHSWQEGFEWKPNCQFTADLEFLSMSRGRSAANFEAVLRNVRGWDVEFRNYMEGCHVNIFMTDMLEIVQKTNISHGMVHNAIWTFCKRGSNYGLRWVENASC